MFYYGETDLEELFQISDQLRATSFVTVARETVLEQIHAQRDRDSYVARPSISSSTGSTGDMATFTPSKRFLDSMRDHMIINALPETSIIDELVLLYFSNSHHLCPIINEARFCHDFFSLDLHEFLETFPLILFFAILSIALTHMENSQIHRVGYGTLHEAQTDFVNVVKRLYRGARFAISHPDDELVLAKTCLLLSFWHGQVDTESNSCWADRAMHHIKNGLRANPLIMNSPHAKPDPFRRKTTYWCCIIRNTMINFATRRTYRIIAEEEPLFGVEEIRGELEGEISNSIFSTKEAKRFYIETTVATCRLSQILNTIMRSQRQNQVQNEWTSSREYGSGDNGIDGGNDDASTDYVRGFLEAGGFDGQIMAVLRSYEQRIAHLSEMNRSGNMNPSKAAFNTVPAEYFRTLCYSSIAVAYQPYLGGAGKSLPGSSSCQLVALEKVNEASANVAAIAERLLRESSVEAIPSGIVAWLALPTVAFLIRSSSSSSSSPPPSNTRETGDSTYPTFGSPLEDLNLDSENSSQEARKLLKLAYLIAMRQEAGQHVWLVLREIHRLAVASRDSQNNDSQSVITESDGSPLSSGSERGKGSMQRRKSQEKGVEGDLDLLVHATRMLDLNLAYEGPRIGHVM